MCPERMPSMHRVYSSAPISETTSPDRMSKSMPRSPSPSGWLFLTSRTTRVDSDTHPSYAQAVVARSATAATLCGTARDDLDVGQERRRRRSTSSITGNPHSNADVPPPRVSQQPPPSSPGVSPLLPPPVPASPSPPPLPLPASG